VLDPSKIASNRREAKALGLKLYHGSICQKHGTTLKRSCSGECLACMAERGKRYAAENKERLAAKKKEWNERNSDKMKAYFRDYHVANKKTKNRISKKWYEANKDHALDLAKEWQHANPEKRREIANRWAANNREHNTASALRWQRANPERACEKSRRWARANRGKATAMGAVRRARKRLSVPPWLSAEHREAIAALYTQAQTERKTVDHIIPIAGCRVCGAQGLHVPWNMQLLTKAENSSKGNRCQDCHDADEAGQTTAIPTAA
jgi:hypothetical protein